MTAPPNPPLLRRHCDELTDSKGLKERYKCQICGYQSSDTEESNLLRYDVESSGKELLTFRNTLHGQLTPCR